ncbi:hypothetical protein GGD81_001899 [Rhodobium orientis]|uniref:Uncharacterized protein n=1 Tax=Rhodobium orientis TaxID=34017 RepID=A0A327JS95_9HYPH|nr:ATP-binding protein [Rhodobium orientis]MBB4302863.1 hypothetical protein [Rhodobium orientis]RAI26238.1 hypothetical protein CH339_14725 [Rhodobium orientis]
MAYRSNPFLERMSERTTSDQDFAHLFSPKILEKLHEDCFAGAVHVFRSPPGGGKSTIMRAFTPSALRAFWNAGPSQVETSRFLVGRGVISEAEGPLMLGVMLSCSSGFADLPPGASAAGDGVFRALLDCRIVMRALRSLEEFLSHLAADPLSDVRLDYVEEVHGSQSIPRLSSPHEMLRWAREKERLVYEYLDISAPKTPDNSPPAHTRFEAVLWLQSVRFLHRDREVATVRLLMIDDVQALRRGQRSQLLDELVQLRPQIPIWLASRSIAFGDRFLSQGVRTGRDIREYPLEEIWGGGSNKQQFISFAHNVLDRRFQMQSVVPGQSFSQFLQEILFSQEIEELFQAAKRRFNEVTDEQSKTLRYSEWIGEAKDRRAGLEAIVALYATRILIARDKASRQLSFDMSPLSSYELEDRENASIRSAAEIFAHKEIDLPYYYGFERVCAMATNNVEELLSLAAALYEGMKAKQVLRRKTHPELLPVEQQKRLKDIATSKRSFITRSHKEGSKAQRLLDSIGYFCRDRTFQINAPYAPGVTGVRLPASELSKFEQLNTRSDATSERLKRVLFECVAENLLVMRESSPSTNREGGYVFYLNRTMCAYYDLPLQYGGWQEATVQRLSSWMERGYQPVGRLELG